MDKINFQGDIISYLDQIIDTAVKLMASDIHIDALEDKSIIRFRIDGDLVIASSLAKEKHQELIARVKILSNLNIAERRLPQDGRISWKDNIDLRVSIIPAIMGEAAIIRILNNKRSSLDLEDLNLDKGVETSLKNLLVNSKGLIISSGPTGCGKTSTLYSLIKKINKESINIITIEDPVEYRIRGCQQIQVNEKIGMTFAKGLRSILRSDPDVIMLGEIRDIETAKIAVRAAITGHMVLTTLHTIDSYSAIIRLADMGIQPYLIASSLAGVQSQRLIKCLCPYCSQDYQPDAKKLSLVEELTGSSLGNYKRPVGCDRCIRGFSGRQAISEIFEIDEDFIELIKESSDASTFKKLAQKKGYKTMIQDGLERVKRGEIFLDDLLSVLYGLGD